MAGGWFESVAAARRRAEQTLPPSVAAALRAGAEAGVTLSQNEAAFGELGFAPTVADKPGGRDLSTSVMGRPVHHESAHTLQPPSDAKVAAARATAPGTACVSAPSAASPFEESSRPTPEMSRFYRSSRAGPPASSAQRPGATGVSTLDWSRTSRDGAARLPQRFDLQASGGSPPR